MNNPIGVYTYSALAGGIGAELTGGNFWQGAAIGIMNAGLNHLGNNWAKSIDKKLEAKMDKITKEVLNDKTTQTDKTLENNKAKDKIINELKDEARENEQEINRLKDQNYKILKFAANLSLDIVTTLLGVKVFGPILFGFEGEIINSNQLYREMKQ
jgi:hypothetical protein